MSWTDRVSTKTTPRDSRRTDPITVMVVDDERDPRESVCEWLTAKGYAVVPARDGADALRQLRAADGHKPDVILLDLMMPVMNGWQFRKAQSNDPELSKIPVVVVTAAGAREQIPAIDADAWLAKPVDFDRLLATIDPLCARSPDTTP